MPDSGGDYIISVGCSDKLGLRHYIESSADISGLARKGNNGGEYVKESPEAIDVYYGTVKVSPIADGDSFEYSYDDPNTVEDK